MFNVVYLWRGERHTLNQTFRSIKAANLAHKAMLADGWTAWVEAVR